MVEIPRFGGVLYVSQRATTLAEAVVEAVAAGVSLRYAALRGADFRRLPLGRARLRGADLSHAYMGGADLRGADLRGANLTDCDLSCADLSGADLASCELFGADLRGARLDGAILHNADLGGAVMDEEHRLNLARVVPLEGAFEAWKKCLGPPLLLPGSLCLRGGAIVRLEVPADARRSNATTRKCRAERVRTLEVIGGEYGISIHDYTTVYRVGELTECDRWEEDRWRECGGGIHFFMTREEAERY